MKLFQTINLKRSSRLGVGGVTKFTIPISEMSNDLKNDVANELQIRTAAHEKNAETPIIKTKEVKK